MCQIIMSIQKLLMSYLFKTVYNITMIYTSKNMHMTAHVYILIHLGSFSIWSNNFAIDLSI